MVEFSEIEEAIRDKFLLRNIECEVFYYGNHRSQSNKNTHKVLARIPMSGSIAFKFVEDFNLPFSSKEGSFNIRQDESQLQKDDRDQTGGYFNFLFLVERNCQ